MYRLKRMHGIRRFIIDSSFVQGGVSQWSKAPSEKGHRTLINWLAGAQRFMVSAVVLVLFCHCWWSLTLDRALDKWVDVMYPELANTQTFWTRVPCTGMVARESASVRLWLPSSCWTVDNGPLSLCPILASLCGLSGWLQPTAVEPYPWPTVLARGHGWLLCPGSRNS